MFQGLAIFSYGTIQTLPFVDIEVVHLFLVFLYQYSCTELPSAKHLFQEKLYDSLYAKHSLFSSQLLHIFNFLQNSKTIFFFNFNSFFKMTKKLYNIMRILLLAILQYSILDHISM